MCLGALGFYGSPYGGVYRWRTHAELSPSSADFNDNATRGDVFNYFAFGAAAAEVELDVLTGNFQVRAKDGGLTKSVGRSIGVLRYFVWSFFGAFADHLLWLLCVFCSRFVGQIFLWTSEIH